MSKRVHSIKMERQRDIYVKLRYKFATQKVGSGIVAVAIEEDALIYNEILRMNSAGAFILGQLQIDISYSELEERMLQKYDTDKATVENVLLNFLSMLSDKELLLNHKGELITKNDIRESVYLL